MPGFSFPMVYLSVTAYYLWLQKFVFYLDLLIHYPPKVTPFCIMEVKSLGEFMFFSVSGYHYEHLKQAGNKTEVFNTFLQELIVNMPGKIYEYSLVIMSFGKLLTSLIY